MVPNLFYIQLFYLLSSIVTTEKCVLHIVLAVETVETYRTDTSKAVEIRLNAPMVREKQGWVIIHLTRFLFTHFNESEINLYIHCSSSTNFHSACHVINTIVTYFDISERQVSSIAQC